MNQEKRMMLVVILSIAVLFVYHFLMAPPQEPAPDNVAEATRVDGSRVESRPGAIGGETRGESAPAVMPQGRVIEVRTPLYTAKITTVGGGITSFLLKEYNDIAGPDGKQLNLVGSDAFQPYTLSVYEENRQASISFHTDAPEALEIAEGNSASVMLLSESPDGIRTYKEYVFHADRYDFEMRLQTTNGSKENIYVRPGINVTQLFTGELAGDSYTFHGIAAANSMGGIQRYSLKDITKEKVAKGPVSWVSADSKYFTWVVFPERQWSLTQALRIGESGVLFSMADTAATLAPGDSVRSATRVFAGPKQSDHLLSVGAGLEDLIDYGWVRVLGKQPGFLLQSRKPRQGHYRNDIILLT
ncbi:MAG: membrane protein insertase YidC, partial [Syntrophorhabdaceae bacterium]|nr:membrane protein insertase YidC [Syntrophorhabdaceae bacterium]